MCAFAWQQQLTTWQKLMNAWNKELLTDELILESLSHEVIESGWLGYSGASEEQIVAAEQRLGVKLPLSYREFLAFTNGWVQITHFCHSLWSVEIVRLFRSGHQDLVDMYTHTGEEIEALSYYKHISATLQISDYTNATVYLLNPETKTTEGEWEAWRFDKAGTARYASFWEMMRAEFDGFLSLKESL